MNSCLLSQAPDSHNPDAVSQQQREHPLLGGVPLPQSQVLSQDVEDSAMWLPLRGPESRVVARRVVQVGLTGSSPNSTAPSPEPSRPAQLTHHRQLKEEELTSLPGLETSALPMIAITMLPKSILQLSPVLTKGNTGI